MMDPIASLLRDNWSAFEDINQRAGHQPVLDALMVFGANDVIFLLPLLLLAFWCLCARWSPLLRQSRGVEEREGIVVRERTLGQQMVLLSVGAVALALVFTLVLGSVIYEPRPFISHPGVVHLLISHAADASFPSDHATVASALASILVLYVPLAAWSWLRHFKHTSGAARAAGLRLLAAAVLLALMAVGMVCMIGVARVYVGVHYPADIAGGVLCGVLAAGLLTALRPWVHALLDRGIHVTERVHLA
jgi:undecaprenyl-diphosphatase